MPLEVSHDPLLVAASFAIALMAGFTGLSLTHGVQRLPAAPRKRAVAAAAIVLGGGIWSMHFVAMLGLQLPLLFYYDALITLISALIAILIVGLGLIVLHFRERTRATITVAGLIVGAGILAMHYVGMAGMQACRAVYTPVSLAASAAVSLVLATLAIWVAYGERTRRNIVLGTVCFAVAVVALHFLAIAGADFLADPLTAMPELVLSNEALAFVVTLAAFTICGGFLLSGATFLPGGAVAAGPEGAGLEAAGPVAPSAPVGPAASAAPVAASGERAVSDGAAPAEAAAPFGPGQDTRPPRSVPYEQNGRTLFADVDTIAAFRAEGHYTVIYRGAERVFCPWSISEAERRLGGAPFIRAHRSYLINPAFVSGFERKRDSGVAYFDGVEALGKVPVSRTRMAAVKETLGL